MRPLHMDLIVAAADPRAGLSRIILLRVVVDINYAVNGIFLGGSYYSGMHATIYRWSVYVALVGAVNYLNAVMRFGGVVITILAGAFPCWC